MYWRQRGAVVSWKGSEDLLRAMDSDTITKISEAPTETPFYLNPNALPFTPNCNAFTEENLPSESCEDHQIDPAVNSGGMYTNQLYWYGPPSTCTYERPDENSSEIVAKEKTVVSPNTKHKKRTSSSIKKGQFGHSFLASSLMGHSTKIMSMGCSVDSKYLVTCADDAQSVDLSSGSSTCSEEKNRSSSESPAESSPGSPTGSRRSARRRRKHHLSREIRLSSCSSPTPTSSSNAASIGPLARFEDLKLNEVELAIALARYLLNYQQMSSLGYPIEYSQDPINAVFYTTDFTSNKKFDVNAKEFIPRKAPQPKEYDSGRGSGSSSPVSGNSSPRALESDPEDDTVERKCARCARHFVQTKDGDYVTRERCLYHWGRLKRDNATSIPIEWGCCGGDPKDPGCSKAPLHVWSGTSVGMNGPLKGFVRTRQRAPGAPRRAILALDCEMCYTGAGLEIAQVEVVGADGRRVYTTYVKPDSPVVDYNTRFSGISPRHIQRATKTLRDVQNDLLNIIDADTILVGHALENDLRALKLLHGKVCDTAVSYAHPRGLPYRMSLKILASTYLNCDFQNGHHSPFEDARVSLDLMLMKVEADLVYSAR